MKTLVCKRLLYLLLFLMLFSTLCYVVYTGHIFHEEPEKVSEVEKLA